MTLKGRTILIISPEPWNHISVSKHHYAVYLAKRRNRVFFLNPPGKRAAVDDTQFVDVLSVHYKGFIKGLKYLPSFVRHLVVKLTYQRLQQLCNTEFDIVWSFDNSVFFDFDALPKQTIKISHIVDLSQNFETKRAAANADYCFCTTEFLKERLLNFNSRVFKIKHGYHFSGTADVTLTVPSIRTRVYYVGNLSIPYIDWILLEEIVDGHQEVDFFFVGPGQDSFSDIVEVRKAKQRVIDSTNTKFLGAVESDDLSIHYDSADILILVYQQCYHKQVANPHKMMEYLGCGRVIVATFTAEYQDVRQKGLMLMSDENSEFPEIFDRALKDLPYWNSQSMQKERKAYAMENTYAKQIDRIEQIICKEDSA